MNMFGEDNIKKYIPLKDRDGLWKDVEPVSQFSSEVDILQINFSLQYNDLNNYFRAILIKNEISERVFNLTTEIIKVNASNYMAWYIRRKCIEFLKIDYNTELEWLNEIGIENQKNYQIWHHRKIILELSNIGKYEKEYLFNVFKVDSKNFHAWCHRIWAVRRFNLFDGEDEFIKVMLDDDCRNNSAWNFKFFVFTYTHDKIDQKLISKEIEFCFSYIDNIPKNESPYNFIRGFFTDVKLKNEVKYEDYPILKEKLLKLVEEDDTNSYAYSLLLDIYQAEKNKDKYKETCEKLQKIDVIRKKYWLWRQQKM